VREVPEILVVCEHNAGRSVAARVLLDHHGGGRVVVRSAGSTPARRVNPIVAQILAERGLDVSKEFPKPVTDADAAGADIVITMGCGEACPIYPVSRGLEWNVPNPAGKPLDEVGVIVDGIERLAVSLLAELSPPEDSPHTWQ
jgi:arsenate reductase (thioredoxin)